MKISSIVCDDAAQAATVKSQLEYIARPMYSSPPVHGSLLVETILSDSDLKALWFKEVKVMKLMCWSCSFYNMCLGVMS